jgi:integrase
VPQNLPAPRSAVGSLAPATTIAAARAAEQAALHDDDPWVRSDTLAAIWLRSPSFSDTTREQYALAWQSWRTVCVGLDVAPVDARRTDVELYIQVLKVGGNPVARKPRPLGPASIARMLSALSSYYRRGLDEEAVRRNPVPAGGRPRAPVESRQPYIDAAQCRALLAAADDDGPRSSALVGLPLLGCLRITEALGIDVEDLREEGGHRFAWITRKGGKERRAPLPPPLWRRVEAAVDDRQSGPLFATASGARMDRGAAWKTIRRLGATAGISTPIGPHTLRHAYLTRGHELGVPLAELQDAAGHADARTTRRYDRSRYDLDRHASYAIARDLGGD